MVFQSFNLFPQYTALENVMLAEKLLAEEKEDYKKNKKEILAEIENHGKEMCIRDRLYLLLIFLNTGCFLKEQTIN